MSNLIIGISGCGGGSKGPAGLYQFLKKNIGSDCKFLALETTPNDVFNNIEKVQQVVISELDKRQVDIYLMGYSMGGAVAAIAAQMIQERQKGAIKGVILLSSQTEGLQVLKSLDSPLLMIHGEKDEYFSARDLTTIFQGCPQRKNMLVVEQGGHNLMPNSKVSSSNILDLALKISEGAKRLFGFELLNKEDSKHSHRSLWAWFFR
jgi:surfactin synthase thioesterase subunit